MFNAENSRRFFARWQKFTNYEARVQLFDIDFNRPWTQIIGKQKLIFGISLLNNSIFAIVGALVPSLIAVTVKTESWLWFGILILGLILTKALNYILFYFDPQLQLQTQQTVTAASHARLLQVDPLNHTFRSSGQTLSKINRGALATRDLVTQIPQTLFLLIVSVVSVSLVIGYFDILLGLVALGLVTMCIGVSYSTVIVKSIGDPISLAAEDRASSINTESLIQNQYIRSIFATTEQLNRLWRINRETTVIKSARWRFNGLTITITQILFITSLGIIGLIVFGSDKFDLITKITLIVTYWSLNSVINMAGVNLSLITQNLSYVQDLFKFMKDFGSQTYPVIDGDEILTTK